MESNERQEAKSVEFRRLWRKPDLREEDYSMTEAATSGTGTDLSMYS